MRTLPHMPIRRLSPDLINRIAAGEVIERPASALKELVENALDAQASDVQIQLRRAGQSFLSVKDNGCGIPREELLLALERHATSKLLHEELFHIQTFGFRGEALPAIGAVSRLSLTSRPATQEQGWTVAVEGGQLQEPRPVLTSYGTCVEVVDLFFATPARLKFLKSPRSEWLAIRYLMEQFALLHPEVSFKVMEEKRLILDYPVNTSEKEWDNLLRARLKLILGETFAEEALFFEKAHKGYSVRGFLGLPTAHGSNAIHQFFFVNERPVKDKILSSVVKIVYHDLVPQGRFPTLVLFLKTPLEEVDVNVHPAKTEVRFSEGAFLKDWLLETLRQALKQTLLPVTQRLGVQTVAAFSRTSRPSSVPSFNSSFLSPVTPFSKGVSMPVKESGIPLPPACLQLVEPQKIPELAEVQPLGYAVGQIHSRYIVAQHATGFLIVDQHAAHERLVYERMKAQALSQNVESEALLIPLFFTLREGDHVLVEEILPPLKCLGFEATLLSEQSLMVRAIPSLLKGEEWDVLFQDMLDTARVSSMQGQFVEDPLSHALNTVLSDQACQKRSIKSGKKLSLIEMNQLLRDMEQTPHAAQCNHGRPTYITLEMQQLDGLFKRHG